MEDDDVIVTAKYDNTVCQKRHEVLYIGLPAVSVAYSEIYGYGFRPYEYLPPPDLTNPNVTVARQHEYQLGMYSLRSFLLPKLFVLVGYITISSGYTGSLFVVWKLLHTSVSSILVLTVYKLTKRIFGCHDIAVMSSILCGSSIHLNILGTHTLINSFISPFVYLILCMLIDDRCKIKSVGPGKPLTNKRGSASPNKSSCTNECFERIIVEDINILDRNSNITDIRHTNETLPKCNRQITISSATKVNLSSLFLCGSLLGFTIYIRPDTTILFVFFFILDVSEKGSRPCFSLFFFTGFTLAVFVCIRDDFVCYGPFIISPWQWIKFNVIGLKATHLFGSVDGIFYFRVLFLGNGLNLLFLSLTCFLFCVNLGNVFRKYKFIFISQCSRRNIKTVFKLCVIVIFVLCLYSLKGHKETRFVHDIIPLMLMVFSHVTIALYKSIPRKYGHRITLYFGLIFIVINQWDVFISMKREHISKWTYKGMQDSGDVNVCLDFIGQQNNVTGVFIDSNIHMTGGHSLLRHNVKVVARNENEYIKFQSDAKEIMPTNSFRNRKTTILTFNRMSDFILVNNSEYLLRSLLMQNDFNYFVINTNNKFPENVYVESFRSGNMMVLKRILDRNHGQYLPFAKAKWNKGNSKMLNTEADWLIYYGAYEEAKWRLQHVLTNEDTNLASYQLLIQLFHMTGENKQARQTLRSCSIRFDKKLCLQMPIRNYMNN